MQPTLISQQKPFAPAAPPRPLFWTVTGRDFGRANAWARRHPSTLNAHIRASLGLPPRRT